jgi:chromatin remodeling complex protein RSC6
MREVHNIEGDTMSARPSKKSNSGSSNSRRNNKNECHEDNLVESNPVEVNVNENVNVNVNVNENVNENVTVNDKFEVMNEKIQNLTVTLKSLQTYVKSVQKDFVKLVKVMGSKKPKKAKVEGGAKKMPSGFAKPTELSPQMCLFLGEPQGTLLARTEVTRRLTSYIKENNLQVEGDKRNIKPDEKLSTILNMGEDNKLTFFNLQSYIKHNFVRSP